MHSPRVPHLSAVFFILRYLKGGRRSVEEFSTEDISIYELKATLMLIGQVTDDLLRAIVPLLEVTW